MTKEDALTLALETLENSRVFVMSREMIKQPEGADWYDNRINAIKEALAQPEQESASIIQAVTDPENQPSQYGTVTLDYHLAKLKEWEDRFEKLSDRALAKPELGPVAWEQFHEHLVERNFCPRCGKRTVDLTTIHTCTPPQGNT